MERIAAWPLVRPLRLAVEAIFPRGALLLSFLTLGYFAMGLVRNRVFANTFGAGAELDAYNAAFRIPEIALDVLVAAGLTAPFVPIFSSLRHDDERAANEFARTVLTVAVLVMTLATFGLFVGAPWFAEQVGRGFDAPTRELYIELFRINCLAQVMFAASITLGEVLVANRRFFFYALAPILYTGGIVVGTVLFADRHGVVATAWGAVGGAAAHLGIRALGTLRTSFRIGPALAVRTASFREFIRLMVPRMVSHPIEPLIFTYFTVLASTLGAGSISALNFALDYQVVPVSLIGVAFSLAVFPTLSAAFADGDRTRFVAVASRNVATIGALTALAAVAMFVLSGLLVDVLLGGGEFDADDAALTTLVLAAFTLSIPFDSLSYPLSRALYATHNTLLQVIASFAGLGTIVLVSTLLVEEVGIVGIPLGYAAGMVVKITLITLFLVPRVRRIGGAGGQPPATTASASESVGTTAI